MSGRRRMMMQARGGGGLPSEYQAVEYLESNGNQWIVTDMVDDGQNSFEVTGCWLKYNGPYPAIFGARVDYDILCGLMAQNSYSKVYYSSIKVISIGDWRDVHTYFLDRPTRDIFVDGSFVINDMQTENTNLPIYLFALNWSSDKRPMEGRIYDFKVYRGGDTICNMKPCYRKTDGVIGMYDIVGKQFYINNGTGTFEKGADV